ncbi:MAG: hypothetical protein HXX20_20100 [Chloroflexi bacterium]|nr:hypothetical protein [Chloroflexota bacterium]
MEDVESLAQQAAERLSEDEALRGNLTDEGFSPLLEWAIEAVLVYARNLESVTPEEAMDSYASRLKRVIQEAVASAETGKLDDPSALLNFELVHPEAIRQKLILLELQKDDPDANAIQISRVLTEALANNSTVSSQ